MNIPDTPPDEERRLRTLKGIGILDSQPEDRFDRLTRMAKLMFDVPIALVSLVDEDRQWFKSCLGLDTLETSRDISFCGHAILDHEIFIVNDTLGDDRFKENPLVVGEPFIRFYAGCPIKTTDGHRIGTICIIDREPRQLGAGDIQTLHDLGALVEHEIEALELALLDELTGITNRRGFMASAEHLLNLARRQDTPVSLVFFDLNNFKEVNDNFGHAEGDLALKVFVDYVKSALRESDIFARFGGDEFVLLLMNTSKDMAEQVVSRTICLLDQYNKKIDRGYEISFSYGVVDFDPKKHKNIDVLLADSDSAMYVFKNSCKQATNK